jgi:UDP-N-acetylmuramoylalanine--D-glutamate ligase
MTEALASFCPDFTHRRVTVMGLGRFGGGVGAVQFLLNRGAAVTVTDVLSAEELSESLQQIDVDRLEALHLGGHCEIDFIASDLIVVNPAIRRDHPMLQVARDAGVPLSSEMNLFWQLRRGPVVGVTGSNGKSTTTALIHSILTAAGCAAHLGGNIGGSLLPRIDDIGPNDWTVLELSSFQLQDLDRLPSSPEIAVVTNFAPNHLDWHGCLEEYRRAKQAVLRWQPPNGIGVLNADDPEVSTWCHHGWCYFFGRMDHGAPGVYLRDDDTLLLRGRGDDSVGRLSKPSGRVENPSYGAGLRAGRPTEETVPVWADLSIVGEHNLYNAMAAAAVALALGISADAIELGVRNFKPLPHRLQFVGEWEVRRFYNDSLATTPESVFAALGSFNEPIVLLAGGYDKGIDLTGLAERIASHTKAAALMGDVSPLLDELIEARRTSPVPHTRRCDDIESSFRWAVEQSEPGDVVLLSPGCASFDWFANFAERGERFTQLVRQLQRAGLPVG